MIALGSAGASCERWFCRCWYQSRLRERIAAFTGKQERKRHASVPRLLIRLQLAKHISVDVPSSESLNQSSLPSRTPSLRSLFAPQSALQVVVSSELGPPSGELAKLRRCGVAWLSASLVGLALFCLLKTVRVRGLKILWRL